MNFWIFQDKPHKRIAVRNAQCAASPSFRGKIVARTICELR